MFRATSNLFESWVRFTIGFALIPLVMAGVVGAVVGIGQGMIGDAASATDLEDAAGFLIVGVGAIFLTLERADARQRPFWDDHGDCQRRRDGLGGAGMAEGRGGQDRRRCGPSTERHRRRCAGKRKPGPPEPGRRRPAAMRRKPEAPSGSARKRIGSNTPRGATRLAAMHGKQTSGAERFKAANAGQQFEIRKARRARKDE